MSVEDRSRHRRDRGRTFFVIVVCLWLLATGAWSWTFVQMRVAAEDDTTCAVYGVGDAYTDLVGEAAWQSFPQPGILCRYDVQMRGSDVEIVELRPVSLSSAVVLLLWGATLFGLRPRRPSAGGGSSGERDAGTRDELDDPSRPRGA